MEVVEVILLHIILYTTLLLIYIGSNLMLSSSGLIAHSVAFRFAKFMEVVEAMEVVSDYYLPTYYIY